VVFVCFTYLGPVCIFSVFLLFSLNFCVVSTSAIDCLERLVSEMTYYASSGTHSLTHSLTHR